MSQLRYTRPPLAQDIQTEDRSAASSQREENHPQSDHVPPRLTRVVEADVHAEQE